MSYFPVSLKFDDKNVLLIGGGTISTFKLKKIKMYQPKSITCIAKKFSDEFLSTCEDHFVLKERSFDERDLDGADIVIVAIEDMALQESIYSMCKERKVLCNCVDLIHCCDFIFPSIIKRGDISVAITSNGRVPGFSATLKDYLEKYIPEELEMGFQEVLKLRQTLPPGPERMKLIRAKAKQFFDEKIMGEKQ